jgi:formyltetrahydrofolate synthetase
VAEKIAAVARKVYGAGEIALSSAARSMVDIIEAGGLGHLPVCIAKTSLSLSHDADLKGTPRGFTLPISQVWPAAGAGYIIAGTPHVRRMPGLPEVPAVDLP